MVEVRQLAGQFFPVRKPPTFVENVAEASPLCPEVHNKERKISINPLPPNYLQSIRSNFAS